MGDVKLSEQLIEMVEHEARGAIDTLRHVTPLGHIESTLTAAAASITNLELTNAELMKRVAELERELVIAWEEDPAVKEMRIDIASLKDRLGISQRVIDDHCVTIADLQSQLEAKDKRVAELDFCWRYDKNAQRLQYKRMERLYADYRALSIRYDMVRTTAANDATAMTRMYESAISDLHKRVAELEARLRFTADSLRSLSPGPHPGPMDAEDYVPLIARMVANLQSQLAWTPVSAGLPTEPGYYLFEHPDTGLTLYELVESELYPWRNIAGARRKAEAMSRLYECFRRSELPKGGES